MKLLVFSFLIGLAICEDPPEHWVEHWFEHDQNLSRVYFNDRVAIYFDDDVNRNATWMNQYFTDVWTYTLKTYGKIGDGDQGRLFAVFHQGKYSGGHPSTYFDASHDYRNVIDIGLGDWLTGEGQQRSIPTHEVAHIVEIASKSIKSSPAFDIWGDSKWAEVYVYDVYSALGFDQLAQEWRDAKLNVHDNFPRENTYWFRDWFYPIYDKHGKTAALNNFFTLLSENFPTHDVNGHKEYTRRMNYGEFVHFWSGAAKTNLKDQATTAFGWPSDYETQFNQARKDFPNVKY